MRRCPTTRGIPRSSRELTDQIGERKRRGSARGRLVDFDGEHSSDRNVVQRDFNKLKTSRGLVTRYDKSTHVSRGLSRRQNQLSLPLLARLTRRRTVVQRRLTC